MPYLNIASNTINRGEMSADEMLRLISPDLTVELIHDIVAAAYDPYVVGMSDFAPINGRGLELYIRATENLRDRLSRTGWRVENIFEVPAVANRKDKVRLVCTTSSDGRVGKSNCAGPAIHDKGKGTLRLAGVEGRTMPIPGLEGYLGEGEPAKHDDLAFYYLIMHMTSDTRRFGSSFLCRHFLRMVCTLVGKIAYSCLRCLRTTNRPSTQRKRPPRILRLFARPPNESVRRAFADLQ